MSVQCHPELLRPFGVAAGVPGELQTTGNSEIWPFRLLDLVSVAYNNTDFVYQFVVCTVVAQRCVMLSEISILKTSAH